MTGGLKISLFRVTLLYSCIAAALAQGDTTQAAMGAHSSPAELRLVAPRDSGDLGFLVVAPDRGFLGNEEVRDAFAPFRAAFRAELAIVSWNGDPGRYVTRALEALRHRGARRVTILPLFLTASHPILARLRSHVAHLRPDDELRFSEHFGASYLAEEVLIDGLSPAANNGSAALLLVGAGAVTDQEDQAMRRELEVLLASAGRHFDLSETSVVMLRDWSASSAGVEASWKSVEAEARRLARGADRTLVLPFHLGRRLDSMMDTNQRLQRTLDGLDVEFLAAGPLPHEAATVWMAREANRLIPLETDEVGYVVMPHGADIDWNESIREPLRELESRLPIEYAFSMADPLIMQRAVRRLEARGCRGIVVLRVFSLESSFRERTEYTLGLADGPGHLMGMAMPPRIRSAAVLATVGGVGSHPLLAEALLDRAREISNDPPHETVLLLAHGTGSESSNDRWLANLEDLARQMRGLGASFAEIRWATWREDWPKLMEQATETIHAIIAEALAQGRTVLVVPERTAGNGPELQDLAHLEGVRITRGFAPHSLFGRWVEAKLAEGRRMLDEYARPAAGGAERTN